MAAIGVDGNDFRASLASNKELRASLARPVRAFLCLAVGAFCLAIDATCQSKEARFSDDKHIKDESAAAMDGATYLAGAL
jgi:hypothetical protein